jgi:hypothetical protein
MRVIRGKLEGRQTMEVSGILVRSTSIAGKLMES